MYEQCRLGEKGEEKKNRCSVLINQAESVSVATAAKANLCVLVGNDMSEAVRVATAVSGFDALSNLVVAKVVPSDSNVCTAADCKLEDSKW